MMIILSSLSLSPDIHRCMCWKQNQSNMIIDNDNNKRKRSTDQFKSNFNHSWYWLLSIIFYCCSNYATNKQKIDFNFMENDFIIVYFRYHCIKIFILYVSIFKQTENFCFWTIRQTFLFSIFLVLFFIVLFLLFIRFFLNEGFFPLFIKMMIISV